MIVHKDEKMKGNGEGGKKRSIKGGWRDGKKTKWGRGGKEEEIGRGQWRGTRRVGRGLVEEWG